MGPGGGMLGLCGERSVHFQVFPALAWALSRWRPDLCIHVVAENVASMRPAHQRAMCASLGVRGADHAQAFDAAAWTSMPRRRTFLSTLAPVDRSYRPPRRPEPWDAGWALAPGGRAPTMLRAQSAPGEPIRASTCQYGPGSRLDRRGSD